MSYLMSYVPPNKRADQAVPKPEFPPNYKFSLPKTNPHYRAEDEHSAFDQSTHSFSRVREAPEGYRKGSKGGYVADRPVIHVSSNCITRVLVATYKDTEAYLDFVPYNYRSYLHLDDRDLYTIVDSESNAKLKNQENHNAEDHKQNSKQDIKKVDQCKNEVDADVILITGEKKVDASQQSHEDSSIIQESQGETQGDTQGKLKQDSKTKEDINDTTKEIDSQVSDTEEKFFDFFIDSESEIGGSKPKEEVRNEERDYFLSLPPPPNESELISQYSLSLASSREIKVLYYKILPLLQESLHHIHDFISRPTPKGYFHVKLLMRLGKILYNGKSSRYSRLDRFESLSTSELEYNLHKKKRISKTFETNVGEKTFEDMKKRANEDAHSRKNHEKYIISLQDSSYGNDLLRLVFYVKKSEVHYHTGEVKTYSSLVFRKAEFAAQRYMVLDINCLSKQTDRRFIMNLEYELKDLDNETKQIVDAFLKFSKIDYSLKGGLSLHQNFEKFIGALSRRYHIKTIRHISRTIFYVKNKKFTFSVDNSFEYDVKMGRTSYCAEVVPISWKRLLKNDKGDKAQTGPTSTEDISSSDHEPKWTVENIERDFYPLLAFCEEYVP